MIYRRVERKSYTCKGEDLTRTVVHAETSNNGLKNLKDYKPPSPMYSQEVFNRMSYNERLQLKKSFPEEYERLNERG